MRGWEKHMPQPKLKNKRKSNRQILEDWLWAHLVVDALAKNDLRDLAEGRVEGIDHYEVGLRGAYLTIEINETLRRMKAIQIELAKYEERLEAIIEVEVNDDGRAVATVGNDPNADLIVPFSGFLVGLDGEPLTTEGDEDEQDS